MRETIKDWRSEWIQTNGPTDELEVVITDSSLDAFHSEVYSGSFAEIPEQLYEKQVIEYWRIIASSVPEREGAYSLMV